MTMTKKPPLAAFVYFGPDRRMAPRSEYDGVPYYVAHLQGSGTVELALRRASRPENEWLRTALTLAELEEARQERAQKGGKRVFRDEAVIAALLRLPKRAFLDDSAIDFGAYHQQNIVRKA